YRPLASHTRMDTPKITTEDRLHCVFCHRPMSETAFLRRKVASRAATRIKLVTTYKSFPLGPPFQA
ncbi:MAG: hypothetical protein WBQ15_21625, partial [Candidatus Sulfotelmatobacter sp.]